MNLSLIITTEDTSYLKIWDAETRTILWYYVPTADKELLKEWFPKTTVRPHTSRVIVNRDLRVVVKRREGNKLLTEYMVRMLGVETGERKLLNLIK